MKRILTSVLAVFVIAMILPGLAGASDSCLRGNERIAYPRGADCYFTSRDDYKFTNDPAGCAGSFCGCYCYGAWWCEAVYTSFEIPNCSGVCCTTGSLGCSCP